VHPPRIDGQPERPVDQVFSSRRSFISSPL
jgi:hypothetical protein